MLELREISLFPPALRDGQVGRAGLPVNGLGKGACPEESHIFPKARKSTREKKLENTFVPLETAFCQAFWNLAQEWGPLLTSLSCEPVSMALCYVASSTLSMGRGRRRAKAKLGRPCWCEPLGLHELTIHAV